MVRFAASKYKNATTKRLKREHTLYSLKINDLCGEVPVSCGEDVIAWAGEGSGICLAGINDRGSADPKVLHGHGQFIRSLQFDPFNKDILSVCSADGIIKLWNVSNSTAVTTLTSSNNVLMTSYNPVADNILAAANTNSLHVYDISQEKLALSFESPSSFMDWSYDGKLACIGSKNGNISIVDVRSNTLIYSADNLDKNREVHLQWIGLDKLIIGGYRNKTRVVETVQLSSLTSPISSINLGPGSGIPLWCYDPDTAMMWVYTKGGHNFRYFEIEEDGSLRENCKETLEEPIKGICLSPKSVLDVMNGEVSRLVIAHSTSIRPTPCIVPRKSYAEFHDDLFPETRGSVPGIDAEKWLKGENGYRDLISLNPASRNQQNEPCEDTVKEEKVTEEQVEAVQENEKHAAIVSHLSEGQSHYRNILGEVCHNSHNFYGLKNIQTVFGQETNGFHTGSLFGAHLMVGSAGRIGVFDLAASGQINTPQLEVVNVGTPLALEWDPFDGHVLAVGGDDAAVKLWEVRNMKTEAKLIVSFTEHKAKVTAIKYHPTVSGILASCDSNGMVLLWDTTSKTLVKEVDECAECIAMCWSVASGYTLLLLDKSGDITSVDTGSGKKEQISTGNEYRRARMEASKNLLVISGICSGNRRVLKVLKLPKGSSYPVLLQSLQLGQGTSLYSLSLDVDMNVGFLAARGESSILPFEFREEPPYHIIPLTVFSSNSNQHALSAALKTSCDVMKIEIAKFYKLSQDAVHLIVFSVPRVRKEYFQDDLYPESLDLTKPVLSTDQFLQKWEYEPSYKDLCPEGVQRNSEVEVIRPTSAKSKVQLDHIKHQATEKNRDEIFNSFAEQVQSHAGPLEQDLMEGCDEDEWSD